MKHQAASLLVAFLTALAARADGPADNRPDQVRRVPPPGAMLDPEIKSDLQRGLGELTDEIATTKQALASQGQAGERRVEEFLPDVQIFQNAVRYALTYDEIFNPTNEVKAAKALLHAGVERARQLREGHPDWETATGLVVRGYVSRIDGSVQPYGLVVPRSYTPNSPHAFRLDIWFHGRDEKLSELNFLAGRMHSPGEFTPPNALVLHLYGRYCNANRFAGEVDLFEALADVKKHYPIDDNRISVRGFSMGGASCWQFATHDAGLWAAAAPGAGFSETADFLRVFQNETVQPTWYEQKLWHWYDSVDYAVNLFNCPTVAYSGEIDRQKQAADMMAKALAAEGIQLEHVIGPQTAHRYHPAAKEEINRRIDSIVAVGRNPVPRRVRFTTWTLRYNQMLWVTVDALGQHWERARVDAEIADDHTVRATTTNVTALTFAMAPGLCPLDNSRSVHVVLDGVDLVAPKVLSDRSWAAHFVKSGSGWSVAQAPTEGLHKRHGLQGPIDDAFMDSFLMVRPTGQPLNPKLGAWTAAEQAHAIEHWRRQFRGEARIKDDIQVTQTDIESNNLVLWGDPSSNQLLARIAAQLPIRWDQQGVHTADAIYPADRYVPVLIYPNPLNPKRYVVYNSGFTFREYDYLNNARQTPKLPDYAILDMSTPTTSRSPGTVTKAGFFDEDWQLPKK